MGDSSVVVMDQASDFGVRVYSEAEVLKLSVKEITNPQLFDSLQLPTDSGLHDPALGSARNDEECATCGLSGRYCQGHMGHINLVLPVFHPLTFKTLLKILNGTCLSCYQLYMKELDRVLFLHQMELLSRGRVVDACLLADLVVSAKSQEARKPGEPAVTNEPQLLQKVHDLAKELTEKDKSEDLACSKTIEVETARVLDNVVRSGFKPPDTGYCRHCKKRVLVLKQEAFSRITATKKAVRSSAAQMARNATHQETVDGAESAEWRELEQLLVKGNGRCLIMPHLARQVMRKVWGRNQQVLGRAFACLDKVKVAPQPTDIFFINTLLVPPTRYRPMSVMGDKKFENPQTTNLTRALNTNYEIRKLLNEKKNLTLDTTTDLGTQTMEELQVKWAELQLHVNTIFDSDLDKINADAKKTPGIRQDLEKKEGKFRMNMMGKRVNFAARSVISPDMNICTNEIGVPEVFARKLTYPQPVCAWNVHELRQNVINGPDIYPGASAVVNEDGSVTKLSPSSLTQREAVAKQLLTPLNSSGKGQLPKQVLRHMKNGDFMLLNRQPTLHRPSIQAHRARVLPNLKTLRLHYSNCKAYNADFDGDEMNAHFPQSELGRAEAAYIASTDFQYLVPKNGAPLAGLIQDHIVGGVALTIRGQFFYREDYLQLVKSALMDTQRRLRLLPPAILKPRKMWSGKQVVSTIILNVIPKDRPPLSLHGRSNIKEKSWIQKREEAPGSCLSLRAAQMMTDEMGESVVVVEEGQLLQGVLDKAHCGPSSYGLVHCVYELYGGVAAGALLTCLGRVFTAFLKMRGFTLGVEDILVQQQGEDMRTSKISSSLASGEAAALETFNKSSEDCSPSQLTQLLKEAHFSSSDLAMKQLDVCFKKASNKAADDISMKVMGGELFQRFPHNNLQLMVQSGAKGSSINCIQISSMLGQIDLEGRRPPLMLSGQSMPSFLPYDLAFRAGGFVTGRFLTSIAQQEYYFHCMAGREGLIDTAVKTSRSGYLQRCLVKHLEGLKVENDHTVRDSDHSVVQFLYGGDGLEVTKTPFLAEEQMPFLLRNKRVLLPQRKPDATKHQTNKADQGQEIAKIEELKEKILEWRLRHREETGRRSGFLTFCRRRNKKAGNAERSKTLSETTGRSQHTATTELEWRNLNSKKRFKYMAKHSSCPDPVLSQFFRHEGAISEKLQESVDLMRAQLLQVGESYDDKSKLKESKKEGKTLNKIIHNKVLRSRCDPGDAVGLLCAQSIGEPSTQMTLNTFHFAGRGEMNVTLGIPRLREILMTASAKILTPAMDIPVLDSRQAWHRAERLQKRLNRVMFSEVIENVALTECWGEAHTGRYPSLLCKIRFHFLPRKSYKHKVDLQPADVLKKFHTVIYALVRSLTRVKDTAKSDLVTEASMNRADIADKEGGEEAEAEASEDEANDGDSSAVKELSRHRDGQDYEGEDEERHQVGDDDVQQQDEDSMEANEEMQTGNADETSAEQGEEQEQTDQPLSQEEMKDIVHIKNLKFVHDYKQDKKCTWCQIILKVGRMVDVNRLVHKVVNRMVLQEVPGIKRCIISDRNQDGRTKRHLITEGINLQTIMQFDDILDLNQLYTNSIADIQNIYGIEAANKAIIKEVQQVFKPYNIQVNPRHLTLLADYMTCEGSYKGFNRGAIASNPSPLQKMTFETCMNFLVNACLHGQTDHLQSPSARIVAGQVIRCGTGMFSLLHQLTV